MGSFSSPPRRILYVQRASGGGSVVSLKLLVKGLDPTRFQPLVLFYEPSPYAPDFAALGIPTLCLKPGPGNARSSSKGKVKPDVERRSRASRHRRAPLVRLMKRDSVDAVRIARIARQVRADLIHSNVSPSADRASIIAASLVRLPNVCHVRFMRGQSRILDLPLSVLVARYVYISEWVSRQFRNDTGVSAAKGRVVYNPFEFAERPGPRTLQRIRQELGVGPDEALIAHVGRLVEWKGQELFLRAFARVAHDSGAPVRAAIVGGARRTPAGRVFEDGLRSLAQELSISDRVIFTGHRADVADIMAAADVVVHSSIEPEPFGRVVMEAVAVETPVIATSAGGVPEMLIPGETGTLVPPGDEGALGRAIVAVIADMDGARAMARKAREMSKARFDSDLHVHTIQQLYEAVLGD